MKHKIKLSVIATALTLSTSAFATGDENRDRYPSARDAIKTISKTEIKNVSMVESFKKMFTDGKVTGQVQSMYTGLDNKNATNTYATAIGGQLKYELAEFNGFNAAAGFTTTHDIGFATGSDNHQNDELSGTKGSYTELTEAYINYAINGFTIRAGRQIVDTPLADSDDIRMVPDTFEAYTASYEANGLSIMAGHLTRWQGIDARLDDGWSKTGEDGVNFAGVVYENDLVDVNAWYYDISNASASDIATGADANGNKSFYIDAHGHIHLNEDAVLHFGAQYLIQSEEDNSNVKSKIYGVSTELVIGGLGINLAYNKSLKQEGKHSFSGYGGGTLFTSMDTMILDEITEDREASAIVGGLVYSISDFNLLYAYGDFSGDKDSTGVKAHIVEQNIGVEYTPNDDFTLSVMYRKDQNKEDTSSTDFNDDNFRILASYNF